MVAVPATRSSSSVAPPRRVGRYDLLTELGRGGMASVYLARGFGSAGFERLAAVKLLHRGLCADEDFVEMFLDEARVAARLHHPNATAIIDVGADGPQLYMVMDYVEGDTLHAVQCAAAGLHRAVPLGIALRIVLDALAGLDAAHELRGADGGSLGLIHRDVTPHNVLVGVDGAARLVDFGIARAAGRSGVTTAGVLKGKLSFMAPEQIYGRPVDRRADLFSMGVTLWETIALRRCFPSRESAPLSRVAQAPYRPLRDVAPHIPAALDDICRRALAFDPADRFATAAEFAESIEDAFRGDLSTQRELGQFMSVVAADKVRGEREAARLSSHPLPARSVRPVARVTTPARPAFDLRPPRVPTFDAAPPRPLQSPLGDGLIDAEDVTSIAHAELRRAPVEKARRPVTLPPLPARPAPALARASIAPRPVGADGAALLEVATEAFALQRPRPRPSLVPPPAVRTPVAPPMPSFFPDLDEEDGRVSEVRLAMSPKRTVAALPAAPSAPKLPASALATTSSTIQAPRATGWFRAAVTRLWSRWSSR